MKQIVSLAGSVGELIADAIRNRMCEMCQRMAVLDRRGKVILAAIPIAILRRPL